MDAEDPALRERLVALKLQRDEIAQEIGSLQKRLSSAEPTITPEKIGKLAVLLRDKLHNGPPELRQAYARLVMNEVRVTKEEIRISGSTASGYKTLLERHAYPAIGDLKAEKVSRTDVSRLHLSMRGAPHNASRMIAVLSSMYSYAAKNGNVPDEMNPARGVEQYREDGRERYLSREELQRLGAAIEEGETVGIPWDFDETAPNAKYVPKSWKGQREKLDRYAAAAIRLLLFTGARLQEILRLRWSYVDLERGLLFLPDSKTGRRTIVLSSVALALIEELLPEGGIKGDCSRQTFVIQGETPEKPRADLKRPWAAIKRHAGLEGVRLHDLRHTFASIGAGSSLGLPIVGKLLGHSQPQTTARYAHLDTDPLRRATDLIGTQIAQSLFSKGPT